MIYSRIKKDKKKIPEIFRYLLKNHIIRAVKKIQKKIIKYMVLKKTHNKKYYKLDKTLDTNYLMFYPL